MKYLLSPFILVLITSCTKLGKNVTVEEGLSTQSRAKELIFTKRENQVRKIATHF